ncbi:MAG: SpoIIE family protein phosphatase [Planctomycetota bacterium]
MEKRHRILIVDDTPENLHVLMETLKGDYVIAAAKSGEKALEIAQKEPYPDLVLLDVMMPEMDGYEVCERLSKIDATMNIPVIFVTALAEAGDEERGLGLGAVDYITKPFNPTLVRARVKNQLELKRYRDDLEETVAFRTRELLETTAAKEKLESELRVARSLQLAMVPRDRAVDEGSRWEIAAALLPARAVGGDLYDYFPLDDGRLCFFVGDVSDKGVPAALFMVKTITLLRSEAPRLKDPAEILARVNYELARENDGCMFVTMVVGILDPATGVATVASAGHEFPVLGSPSRGTELVLIAGGPAMGVDLSARYTNQEVFLSPGDGLVLYSDGITEAFDEDGKPFGEVRLLDVAGRHRESDAAEMTRAVLDAVSEYAASVPQSDDICVLTLRYRGAGTGS